MELMYRFKLMWIFLIAMSIIPEVLCNQYNKTNNETGTTFVIINQEFPIKQAMIKCKEFGWAAGLGEIMTESDQDTVTSLIFEIPEASRLGSFWLGIHDVWVQGNFVLLSDGEGVPYAGAWKGERPGTETGKNCAKMATDDWLWEHANCNQEHGVLCSIPADDPRNPECHFPDVFGSGACYTDGGQTEKVTFETARTTCSQEGGGQAILPVPASSKDARSMQLYGELLSGGVFDKVWIAAQKLVSDRWFKDVNGENVTLNDLSEWRDNELPPFVTESKNKCIVLNILKDYKYEAIECVDGDTEGFLCQIPGKLSGDHGGPQSGIFV